MRMSLIVAMTPARVIGVGGQLPWHLPADLKRFKSLTMGSPILMGRKTHESIGRALPGRRNIVISRQVDYQAPECDVFSALQVAIRSCASEPEVFIIGGEALYREALGQAHRIYLTLVRANVAGDVFFPKLEPSVWEETVVAEMSADANHAYPYCFKVLNRLGEGCAH
ncbi:MAG: dihydrofolate reductase [Pseudomonadota bacterium]